MNKIVKNPIFRICGIIIILYYALFKNQHDPDALNKRLAPEHIKSNLSEISEKSVYIIHNIKKAEEIKKSAAEKPTEIENEKQ
jgi:hypothetical protein